MKLNVRNTCMNINEHYRERIMIKIHGVGFTGPIVEFPILIIGRGYRKFNV